ncbi:GNAT family N-acetyltransferase [Rummeliibacillus sp. NPDC094406]|uniref:GNAT family N-acetyltransferase n=1 Tax=Rummeliibacillus sp. NPDC094406 TaxID=3364511 RepID=UPI0038064CCC
MEIQFLTANTIDDASNLFDQYRQFYEQTSDLEGAKAFLNSRLEQQQSLVLLAYIDSSPVGFAQLYPTFSSVAMKRAFILNDLFVSKDARNLGVARTLIEECYKFCKANDARYITLETANDNLTAQSLYKKMGMKHDQSMLHFTKYW